MPPQSIPARAPSTSSPLRSEQLFNRRCYQQICCATLEGLDVGLSGPKVAVSFSVALTTGGHERRCRALQDHRQLWRRAAPHPAGGGGQPARRVRRLLRRYRAPILLQLWVLSLSTGPETWIALLVT